MSEDDTISVDLTKEEFDLVIDALNCFDYDRSACAEDSDEIEALIKKLETRKEES